MTKKIVEVKRLLIVELIFLIVELMFLIVEQITAWKISGQFWKSLSKCIISFLIHRSYAARKLIVLAPFFGVGIYGCIL